MHDSRTCLPRLAIVLGFALAACGPPPEADYAVSERARAAPPPKLEPTALFTAPMKAGAVTAAQLGPETEALAARAAALRERGEALSETGVLDPDRRTRLETTPPE